MTTPDPRESEGRAAMPDVGSEDPRTGTGRSLVRIQKRIHIATDPDAVLDESIVAPAYYNSFTTSLVQAGGGKIAIGVSSPRAGDGSSLVAANLATFLALSDSGETVLVDANVRRPAVHSIFGVEQGPGLMETLTEPDIYLRATKIDRLYILPVGRRGLRPATEGQRTGAVGGFVSPLSSLDLLTEFRNLLYSLRESFDVVIFDLPPVHEPDVPTAFVKQLDGIVVVVRSGQTRQEDIDRTLFHVSEEKVLGFVFNRFDPPR